MARLTAEQKPPLDRRRVPRVGYTERIIIESATGEETPGFARDLSRTGIAFFTTKELPFDAVRLTLPKGEAHAPADGTGEHRPLHAN